MRILIFLSCVFLFFITDAQNITFLDVKLNNILTTYPTVDSDDDGVADLILDSNGDGVIQVNETIGVTHLIIHQNAQTLSSTRFNSIVGLEQFSDLESLDILSSLLNNVEISQFNVLKSLIIRDGNSLQNTITLNNSNLEEFRLSNANLSNIVFLNSNNLETLNLDFVGISNIDFNTISNLKNLSLSGISGFSSLDLGVLNNLETLNISLFNLNTLNISGCVNLKEIYITENQFLNSINLDQNILLEKVGFSTKLYSNNLLGNLNQLKEIEIKTNDGSFSSSATSIDLSHIQNLEVLKLTRFDNLSSLSLHTASSSLKELELLDTQIQLMDLTPHTFLEKINFSSSQLMNFNISTNLLLKELTFEAPGYNQIPFLNNTNLQSIEVFGLISISQIDLSNFISLEYLQIGNFDNSLTNINVLNNIPLKELLIHNLPGISNIDLSNNLQLESLGLGLNFVGQGLPNLSNIDISNNTSLTSLRVVDTPLTSIDLSNNVNLNEVYIRYADSLTEVSLIENNSLDTILIFDNSNLQNIFMKNASLPNSFNQFAPFFFDRNPSLSYICVRDDKIDQIRNIASFYGIYPNLVVNSYCSFTPGGSFNDIQGNISIDLDSNGCDPTDPVFSNFNFTATDGTISGTISSNLLGEYYAPVSDGQHTITPNPENPSYWNFSPSSVTVDFPTQASPFTQDFCVTANGVVEDLEVFVVPLEQARPGFDTDYMVRIKNKGNQTASGNLTLDYEDGFMTLLSSTPTASQPATNQLSWSFSNLQPFQMEEYVFTMTLNTPTQATNPLNSNDILTFTGAVTGQGTDAMPADNTMIFDQTVVNSFDPNDKTCLQGETIDPADVGEYVHYMIRFENTGTASAINVVIKDEIDLTKFDITTLVPLGGSHDYYTRIREGNIVEFIHENINLDFNDATNDGHVLFKIKTLNTLVAGDTFDNDAGIYFDFNFPIITNNEVVTVMSTASIGESSDSTISVYPNPTNGILNINSDHSIQTIDIFDLNGRMISKYDFTSSNTLQQIDLSQLGTGVYFVTVTSDLGKSTHKLIVE